jgi:hypothetical protein
MGFIACSCGSGFSQTLATDTILARRYYTSGDFLQQARQYGSAILYFQKAAAPYQQLHQPLAYAYYI